MTRLGAIIRQAARDYDSVNGAGQALRDALIFAAIMPVLFAIAIFIAAISGRY